MNRHRLHRFCAVGLMLALGVCGPARAQDADPRPARKGVLFYAGFDGTRDAEAVGNGKATLVGGGGKLTADGFDSIRGSAIQTGDGAGFLEFSAADNVFPDEGTIELWIKPENWFPNDNQQDRSDWRSRCARATTRDGRPRRTALAQIRPTGAM